MFQPDGDAADLDLDPAEQTRLRTAGLAAYAAMYGAAAPALGTGFAPIEGALAVWNPTDADPSFNYLTGFEAAPDPDRAWALGLAAASAGGARVFGVAIADDRAAWATAMRRAELGLVYDADELVWAARLRPPTRPPVAARGVEVRTADVAPDVFARALNRGWELPEEHGRGRLYASTLGLPGWGHYLAVIGDEPAGGAVLCRHEGVAVCMVAATDPRFRGRGIQTTLIERRLVDAAATGCDLAMVETVAGNASARNYQRAGFRLVTRRRIYAVSLE